MKLFTFFLWAALYLGAFKLRAQSAAIDSLQTLLQSHNNPDTTRASILNALAFQYKSVDPAKSFGYARQALMLAKQTGYKAVIPKAYRTLGSFYYQRGAYNKAFEAFDYADKTAAIISDTLTMAWANNGKGTVFHSQSNYPKALGYYLKAVRLFELTGRKKEAASIMGNVGVLYKEMGQLSQALSHFEHGFQLQKQMGDRGEMARFLNNIGNIYNDQKEYNKAEEIYMQGLQLARLENNLHLEALILRNLMEVEQFKGETAKAFQFGHRSIQLYKQIGEQEGVADAGYRLALLHLQAANTDSAISYGNDALKVAETIGFKRNIFNTYDVLAKAYATKGQFTKAYLAQQQYIALKDSLTGEDQQSMVAALKFQYELDKKQSQIELLTKEKQFQNEKVNNQRVRFYALLMVLFLVALLVMLLIRSNRRKMKDNFILSQQKEEIHNTYQELKNTQEQLIQREKMASLGELTAGIAHEIQNPLNFVNNFADISAELAEELKQDIKTGNDKEALAIVDDVVENLKKVIFHGQRADGIVKAMLQHSRRDTGQKEPTNINALADEYLRLSYHGLRAKDKSFNATLNTSYDPGLPLVNIVAPDVGRVLLNIINNALYAIHEKKKHELQTYQPALWLSTKLAQDAQQQPVAQITIRDNGPGIPQSILTKIYQPFFTTKPTGSGTGLGLSLSYDIIKAHKGQIRVNTKEGDFTEFIIELPIQ